MPRSLLREHHRMFMPICAVCVALLVSSIALLPPAASADRAHRRLHRVRGKIHETQGDLEDASHSLRALARRLAASRTDLLKARRRSVSARAALGTAVRVDAERQRQLQAAEAALSAAQARLDTATSAVAEQRAEVGALAASDYALGDPALMRLTVLLKSQDPGAVVNQLNTVDSLMSRQHALLDQLRLRRTTMARRKTEVQTAATRVAAQRKAAADVLALKRALEARAWAARADLARVVARNRAATRAAAHMRRHDAKKLRRLRAQESRRIKELIASRALRHHSYHGSTGGLLLRPVPGYVTSPYGWRIHPIYGYWGLHDGTDFSAPCGTPERAVGTGVVISEEWSEIYGNRLYLDLGKVNGKNMTAVYNHLQSYSSRTGEHVDRGQTVGLAGTTGWSTGCHLHFTVLIDGNPVDPMHYIG